MHAHIRKANPRGDIVRKFGAPESAERERRIVRRGITYGRRNRHPNAFQALDDLPSDGVGLLFMCFQASIRNQFAFIQRGWANNQAFIDEGAGIDPVIGQLDSEQPGGPKAEPVAQTWRPEYGSDQRPTQASFGSFVRMRGGEFFFAPSLPFLRGLAATA